MLLQQTYLQTYLLAAFGDLLLLGWSIPCADHPDGLAARIQHLVDGRVITAEHSGKTFLDRRIPSLAVFARHVGRAGKHFPANN